MKLYRHYKNKPYKVLGHVKHSETLEDLTLYETLYENPNGKIWVRPKSMFEEQVSINGTRVDRFAKLASRIEAHENVSAEFVDSQLSKLVKEIFGVWEPENFHSRLRNSSRHLLLVLYVENEPVGFKIGYEVDHQTLYSWLGGVVPPYRGVGVGAELMKAQHAWAQKMGYRCIQTKTQNQFREQLILNLRFGFQVVGYSSSQEGSEKILMKKQLDKED